MKRDPICHMEVLNDGAITAERYGQKFYFCCEGCRQRFISSGPTHHPKKNYDLIIIGGGPAGLTAAVYASMMKLSAFLIARDLGGQAIDSTAVENYMGFDFITGPELIGRFREQILRSHYLDHLIGDVERIERMHDEFVVTTSDLDVYTARSVIMATGMARRKLGVPGEEGFWRKGLWPGTAQDFSFVRDKEAVVIGGGNSAIQTVEGLHKVTSKITMVSLTSLTADPAVIERLRCVEHLRLFEEYKVVEFTGTDKLTGVTIRKLASDETVRLPAEGAFISIGFRPNSSLVSHLAQLNNRGEIMINHDCSTATPGLYAAGDATDAFGKRIIIAAGEGAKAALAVKQHMLRLRKKEGAAVCV